MTTNQITQAARRKLLETTTEIISDTTILLYANLAYQDVWKRAFPNTDVDSATVTFTSGVGSLPATFGTMYGPGFDTYGNSFEEVSIEDFDRVALSRMVTIEDGEIKVYPTDTASLTIKFWPEPEELTSTQNPTINSYLHEPIIYGILARAYEDLQDHELAQFNATKFETDLNNRLERQSIYEETNQRGAQMFVPQTLIGGIDTTF